MKRQYAVSFFLMIRWSVEKIFIIDSLNSSTGGARHWNPSFTKFATLNVLQSFIDNLEIAFDCTTSIVVNFKPHHSLDWLWLRCWVQSWQFVTIFQGLINPGGNVKYPCLEPVHRTEHYPHMTTPDTNQ